MNTQAQMNESIILLVACCCSRLELVPMARRPASLRSNLQSWRAPQPTATDTRKMHPTSCSSCMYLNLCLFVRMHVCGSDWRCQWRSSSGPAS
jgi:hypothetical protein